MSALLQLKNITKRFGYRTILKDLNLEIQSGEFVYLLGNNGAGKTTLLRMIATLLAPSKGELYYQGKRYTDTKTELLRNLGTLSHESRLYGDLTAAENLKLFAILYEVPNWKKRIPEVLKEVDLVSAGDLAVRTFSNGMTKRVGIARLLLYLPQLLLLDEPYTGLDQKSVQWFQNYLVQHQARGGTVVLVTHQLELGWQQATRGIMLHHRSVAHDFPVSEWNQEQYQNWITSKSLCSFS